MALGPTPHIRLKIDKDGELYIVDQNTNEKKLIAMRKNSDGSRTSRAIASEIEDSIFDFRWDHQESKKPEPKREKKAKSKAKKEEAKPAEGESTNA